MERHEISNFQAIRDCIELTEKYSIDECLIAAKKFCDSIDAGPDRFLKLMFEKREDECLDEVIQLSVAGWGARNVLSALLYLDGDTDGHQLHLAEYKYASEHATEDLNKLFD